jgi:hypothetical protein
MATSKHSLNLQVPSPVLSHRCASKHLLIPGNGSYVSVPPTLATADQKTPTVHYITILKLADLHLLDDNNEHNDLMCGTGNHEDEENVFGVLCVSQRGLHCQGTISIFFTSEKMNQKFIFRTRILASQESIRSRNRLRYFGESTERRR